MSFPQYFQYISNFRSQITYSYVKCGCSINFFLNSANQICRGTETSRYFRESLGLRDNESRLYFADIVLLSLCVVGFICGVFLVIICFSSLLLCCLFWCSRKAVLRDWGISWVSSFKVLFTVLLLNVVYRVSSCPIIRIFRLNTITPRMNAISSSRHLWVSAGTIKPTRRLVRPATTQIRLRFRAVWSESSLEACAF